MSSSPLRARSPVTSQRAFDGERPGRRAHLQRLSIEPLKEQQLPGAVSRAPRGTKNGGAGPFNERPLGNSRPVPSPQTGKEKCSSSVTRCLKETLSQPQRPHVHDKGASGTGLEANSPSRGRSTRVWPVHPSGLSLAPVPSHSPLWALLPSTPQDAPTGSRPPLGNREKGPAPQPAQPPCPVPALGQCWEVERGSSPTRMACSGTVKENLRQGNPMTSLKQRA